MGGLPAQKHQFLLWIVILVSMKNRKLLTLLTALLLGHIGTAAADGTAPPTRGASSVGTQQVFPLAAVTGDRTGKITASTNYQVTIILPAEVQNVGVNASKQDVLIPTVDKSDGRVIFLDVLKSGGTATLNIRLVSEGEPVIVKLVVDLSEAKDGVLTYAVRSDLKEPGTQAPAPATFQAAPQSAAAPAARTPAAAPALPAPAVQPLVKVQDGVRVELTPTPGETGLTRTYAVKVTTLTPQDTAYHIDVTANASAQGRSVVGSAQLTPNEPHQIGKTEFTGRLTITFTEPTRSAVLLVLVRPVHAQATRSGHYIGFKVRL